MNFVWPVLASVIPDKLPAGYRFGAGRTTGPKAHIHKGIDIGEYGTMAVAAGPGQVVRAYSYNAYGGPGIIDIDHEGGEWRTRYLHLDPKTFLVKVGDSVRAGQELGRAAMLTGGAAASHVHFEILHRDAAGKYHALDPELILRAGIGGLSLVVVASALIYFLVR